MTRTRTHTRTSTGTSTSSGGAAAPESAPPDPARFSFRPVDPAADAGLLHGWVTHPKASFWLMSDADRYDVERAYADIARAPYQDAFVGEYDGAPVCLMERYDPARVELAGLYEPEPGDVGMHFLVAPADPSARPVHGFSRAVLQAVLAALFADPAVRRVVVEPDVRNTAVQALNADAGFVAVRRIRKPEKEALLSVCTRERFEAAR